MARFVNYAPGQAWLLPPRVEDELGKEHLACFIHELVERLDLTAFEDVYSDDGRPAYPPQMMLKLWLYAYARGLTSSRKLEQLVREDLGFRFLAAGWKPDFWTLNEFRRRHPKAVNDVFTQVLEAAREMGMGKLGRVAIDSTRVKANASIDRADKAESLRRERARIRQRIRRWQQKANRDNNEETPPEPDEMKPWRRRLDEIPRQLKQLRKSKQKRASRTDPESRYLRKRGGFCLGYSAEVAVSDDHLIVAHTVHQRANDAASLEAMVKQTKRECGAYPQAVLADSGYYSQQQIQAVERRKVETYVPDAVLAKELAGGERVEMNERQRKRTPGLYEMRERLRGPTAREQIKRRKALVESVFGTLKQQRGMRQFWRRGLEAVRTEWSWATTAFNITRMFHQRLEPAS